MQMEKKEREQIAHVLYESKNALLAKDAIKLKQLSDHTIHDSCHYQDIGNITLAIMLYALSKIIEREDYKKISKWNNLVKRLSKELELAGKAVIEQDSNAYQEHVKKARQAMESQSVQIKPYIQSILEKAAINKGFKLYQHGLSMEKTSNLLGISQWELSTYIAQKQQEYEVKQDQTLDVKKRARMALEFFS